MGEPSHALLAKEELSSDWDPFSKAGRERLQSHDLERSAVARGLLEAHLAVTDALTEQIHRLEALIEETAIAREETQQLMAIPGVSFCSSVLIAGEIGEVGRVDRAEELVSYAGLDPVVRESGGTRTKGGISKQGSGALRWILVQGSNGALHTVQDPYLGKFYGRLKRRKNHQIAIVATARKLRVSIYHMLDRKEVYDPLA